MPMPRHVLNISKRSVAGRRFNNLDARDGLAKLGWNSAHCAWSDPPDTKNEYVRLRGSTNRSITDILGKVATITGNLNGYYRNAGCIKELPQYKQADLLHFHIVHEKWLSLHDLTALAKNKSVVWTWHDPYMMTGHCIYPFDCTRYENGCLVCPHLHYHFPIMRDRSHKNLREKVEAVTRIDPLVIVASNYMEDMVQRSLYGGKARIKVIPFGVDFGSLSPPADMRQKFGIPENHTVFGFRASHSDYKGAHLVVEALEQLAESHGALPVTLIAFQEKDMCESLKGKMQVIETGWIEDGTIKDYYASMDYFMMPSRVEAFGLMAIEAMAAGACPIVTHGTALPELIKAPVHGISVPHTIDAVREAILSGILTVKDRRMARSQRMKFAQDAYCTERFCKELAAAYDEEIEYRSRDRRSA